MKNMKITQKLTLLFALLGASSAYSQLCNTTTMESSLYSPSKIITCDFNGDSRQDIVFLDSLSNNLFWKRNTGNNQFTSALPLVGGAEILFLKSADFNNDGFDEIIFTTNTTVFYVSYTGATTIDFNSIFDTPVLYYIKAMEIGDFNNDGSDGLVIGYYRNSTLNVIVDVFNNVNGSLSLENILNGTFGTISDLAVGDITGDGKPDIAMSGYSNLWFKNLSNGQFSTYNTVSSASSDYGRIFLMDYDNDNDMELVNLDNNGRLQSYNIDPFGNWLYNPTTIITGLPANTEIWKKVNKDGNDMILVGSSTEIIGLENTSNSFTQQSICENFAGLRDVALITNQDNSTDFIYSSDTEGTIKRIEIVSSAAVSSVSAHPFKLYPNPSTGIFQIETNENIDIRNIRVISTIGQEFTPEKMGANIYSLENVSSGLYRVLIEDMEGQLSTYSLLKVD